MISDKRLRLLSGPDYIASEPGQIAAELVAARARIADLENVKGPCPNCGAILKHAGDCPTFARAKRSTNSGEGKSQ